jgi:hypothetical protein
MSMWPMDNPKARPLDPPPRRARKQTPSIQKQPTTGSEGIEITLGVQNGGIEPKQQVEVDKVPPPHQQPKT